MKTLKELLHINENVGPKRPFILEKNGDVNWRKKSDNLIGSPEEVDGDFIAEYMQLISLEGGPKKVAKTFEVSNNNLTTLEGGPEFVGEIYNCCDNELKSLKGAPSKINVGFDCTNNELTSFEHFPKDIDGWALISGNNIESFVGIYEHIDRIGGSIGVGTQHVKEGGLGLLLIKDLKGVYIHNKGTELQYNQRFQKALHIIDRYLKLGGGERYLLDCQKELIEMGLDEFAEL